MTTPTDPSTPDLERALLLWQYSPDALARADALHAVGKAAYRVPGHPFRFQVSAALPLPRCLIQALDGVWLGPAEGTWPQFAAVDAPAVDWPALVAANPTEMTWAVENMARNDCPNPAGITTAIDLLDKAGMQPWLSVWLWVSPEGHIEVDPLGLWAPPDIPTALVEQASEILIAAGRPPRTPRLPDRRARVLAPERLVTRRHDDLHPRVARRTVP